VSPICCFRAERGKAHTRYGQRPVLGRGVDERERPKWRPHKGLSTDA